MYWTTVPSGARRHQACFIVTRLTGRANIRANTCAASAASSRPMATPGSPGLRQPCRRSGLHGACPAQILRRVRNIEIAAGADRDGQDRRALRDQADIRGRPPDERLRVRLERTAPLLMEMKTWLGNNADACLRPRRVGKGNSLCAVALERTPLILRDGRACIDNSAAERAMRPIALGRRNWTFAGSDAGGERAAAIYSLIETAKLHGLDPEAYFRHVLNGSPATREPRARTAAVERYRHTSKARSAARCLSETVNDTDRARGRQLRKGELSRVCHALPN